MRIAIDIPEHHFSPTWQIAAGALEYEAANHRAGNKDLSILLPHSLRSTAEEKDPSNWDAVIARIPHPELSIPQVIVAHGYSQVSVIVSDDEITRLAVDQFMSLGLAHLAFFGRTDWHKPRWIPFRQHAEERGMDPVLIVSQMKPEDALLKLPKPCGIMAYNDQFAFRLLRVCKNTGLQVPRDIQVISVDNTPACMESTPALSSISMPYTSVGYHAADLCRRMLNGETVESVQLSPSGLIIRDSTKAEDDGLKTASEIAHYLRMNFRYPIQMGDIVRRSTLSPRHITEIFSSAYGVTPIAYLKDLRLAEAKKMLQSGNVKLDEIVQECGYRDANHLCRIFRERVGLPPQAYAKKHGK